eukprot:TRINITY_DN244_c0_g1_i1.p1 TRINITY_DN244_c0_g1~~TRINITY_DN244_c0_g1_i1.p1  ORF type:complete len:1070 (-),score=307.61 TRINITY_DN244_c0_g1_i1:263-3472(-)
MSKPSESTSSYIYSREDILALFKKDEAEVVPENLSRFPDVFSERAQYPVAFSRSSSAPASGDVVFTRGSRGRGVRGGGRGGWRGTRGGRPVMGQTSSSSVPGVDDRRRKPQDWSSLRPRVASASSGMERSVPPSDPSHTTSETLPLDRSVSAPSKPELPTETVGPSSPKERRTLESGSLVHLGPISDTDNCWYYRNNGDDFNGPVSLKSIHDWIDSGLFDDSVVICHEKERGTGNVFSGRALLGGKVELLRPTVKDSEGPSPTHETLATTGGSEGAAGTSPRSSDEQPSAEDVAPRDREAALPDASISEGEMHPGPQHMGAGGSMFVFPPMGPMGVPIDALQRMRIMGGMDPEMSPDDRQQLQPGMYMPPPMSMYMPQFQMEWMRVMQMGGGQMFHPGMGMPPPPPGMGVASGHPMMGRPMEETQGQGGEGDQDEERQEEHEETQKETESPKPLTEDDILHSVEDSDVEDQPKTVDTKERERSASPVIDVKDMSKRDEGKSDKTEEEEREEEDGSEWVTVDGSRSHRKSSQQPQPKQPQGLQLSASSGSASKESVQKRKIEPARKHSQRVYLEEEDTYSPVSAPPIASGHRVAPWVQEGVPTSAEAAITPKADPEPVSLFKIQSEQQKESQKQRVKEIEERTKEIEEEERQRIERENPWKPVEHVAPKSLRDGGKHAASSSGSGTTTTTTTVPSRRRRRQEVIDVTAEVFAKSDPSVETSMRGPDVYAPSVIVPPSLREIQEQQEKEAAASRGSGSGIKGSKILDSSSSRASRGKTKTAKTVEPVSSAWGSSAPKPHSFLDIQKEEMQKSSQLSPAPGEEKPMSSVLMAPTSVMTSDAASTSDDFFWGSVPDATATSAKRATTTTSKPMVVHRPGSYAALASKQPPRSQLPTSGSSTSAHRPEKKMMGPPPSAASVASRPGPTHPVAEVKHLVETPMAATPEKESVSTDTIVPKMSSELASWCRTELQRLTGSGDLTLAEYLFAIKSDHEVKELIWANLGHSPELSDFAEQYLRHRALELDSHEVKKGPPSSGWFSAPSSSSTGSSSSSAPSGGTHRGSRSSRRRNRRK